MCRLKANGTVKDLLIPVDWDHSQSLLNLKHCNQDIQTAQKSTMPLCFDSSITSHLSLSLREPTFFPTLT